MVICYDHIVFIFFMEFSVRNLKFIIYILISEIVRLFPESMTLAHLIILPKCVHIAGVSVYDV